MEIGTRICGFNENLINNEKSTYIDMGSVVNKLFLD